MVALLEWAHWEKPSPGLSAFEDFMTNLKEPLVAMKPPSWIKALADLNLTAEEYKSMLSDSSEPIDLVNKPIVFDGEEFKFKEDVE